MLEWAYVTSKKIGVSAFITNAVWEGVASCVGHPWLQRGYGVSVCMTGPGLP